jgi:hypothetical protein
MQNIRLVIVILVVLLSSCIDKRIPISEAKKHFWKYNEGFHIGDYIVFEGEIKNGRISNDTIFVFDIPKGLLKGCYSDYAIVTSFDHNDEGKYSFKKKQENR